MNPLQQLTIPPLQRLSKELHIKSIEDLNKKVGFQVFRITR